MSDTKNVIMFRDSREVIPHIKTPIDLVVTDPPYGMKFESNRAQTPEGKQFTNAIEGDEHLGHAINLFHSVMGPIIARMQPESELYIFTAWHILEYWIPAVKDLAFVQPNGDILNEWWIDPVTGKDAIKWPLDPKKPREHDNGFRLKMMLIWDKGYPGQGDLKGTWGCGYEPCLWVKRGRRPVPERRSAILGYDRIPAKQNIHPTEKPVPLLEKLITFSTDPGAFVVDPFSGSGSTTVAARNTGRNSLAFEIDKDHYERSTKRLEVQGLGW